MSKSTLSQLFPAVRLSKSKIPFVKGVGGSLIRVLGKVKLTLKIGTFTFDHMFHVLERMNHHVILGLDFLKANDAWIKFDTNSLALKSGQVEIPLGSHMYDSGVNVKTIGSVTIPARSQVVLPASCPINATYSKIGLIEPIPSLLAKDKLVGAKCLVKVANKRCLFRIMNPNNVSVNLRPNQVIGTWQSLNSDCLVTDFDLTEEDITSHSVNSFNCNPDDDVKCADILKDLGIDLSDSDISDEDKSTLQQFLASHRNTFAKDVSELGASTVHFHRIDTGDAKPINQRFYRTSPALKKEIDRQIEDMLKNDIIEPSMSNWGSPVVLIKKRNGEYRFAIDYRKINLVSKPISWPLPRLEDVFDTIGESKAQIFSVLDLRSGFWQIPLDPETKDRSAFTTHSGHYQFKKLPFGLRNAPMSFQMVMSEVLRGLNWKCSLVYIDDILCFSKDIPSHLKHLEAIFDRLDQADLKLNPTKCKFAAKRVTYLGHVLSKHGVEVDHEKTKAITTYPVPKSAKDVKAFIGVCNYYRRFVKGFAEIASPLNKLLQKDVPFEWSSACQSAFEKLKQTLVSAPILAFPNFDKQFILRVDASGYSISYILAQLDDSGKEVAIHFGGRSLGPGERKWSITEREGLALFEGIKLFRPYLANESFVAYTDHVSLKWIQSIPNAHGRLGR
jgi:hypothetical protein